MRSSRKAKSTSAQVVCHEDLESEKVRDVGTKFIVEPGTTIASAVKSK